MDKDNQRFGDFIREKRLKAPGNLTLKMVAEQLNISLSLLSDIENNRRKPFEEEKLKKFAEITGLNKEDIDKLYDLAGRERHEIPKDIEDIMMYTEIGDIARLALRKTKEGKISAESWKRLIEDKGDKNG